MSTWSIIVLIIALLASIVAILVRIEDRREIDRLEEGELSADDFEIVE